MLVLAVPPHVPIFVVPRVSPGAGAQDKAGDDEALGLIRLLGQIHVVLAHFWLVWGELRVVGGEAQRETSITKVSTLHTKYGGKTRSA